MSIEQKIQQILAESQKKGLSEAEVELDAQQGDPLAQIEIEPNNARNNVDRQDIDTGEKDENEHTENAAPAEPSNLQQMSIKENSDSNYTVDIDHTGKPDFFAKQLNISLKHDKEYSTLATGSKKNLRKYLAHHYGSIDDAKDMHPEVFKESFDSDYKEDIDALVSGEELTEEFKQKAATIFEAAVLTRVKQEVARLDEAYQVQLDERVEEIKEGLVEKVDGYLDYVVEQWMKDNEIALESGMKSEILEGFVSGLKGLFEQHYIEVPEEKFDVLGSMQEQIAGLTTKLDEQVETNIKLRNKLAFAQAEAVVRDLAEGLTDTDKDKFFTLVEELEFDGLNSFTKKAQTIRESYFTKKAPIQEAKSYVVTDEPVVLAEETKRKQQVDPQMANYLNVLNNLIK